MNILILLMVLMGTRSMRSSEACKRKLYGRKKMSDSKEELLELCINGNVIGVGTLKVCKLYMQNNHPDTSYRLTPLGTVIEDLRKWKKK